MKTFHCDHCNMLVFFENHQCEKCGERLGFNPDLLEISSEKNWASGSPSNSPVHPCANLDSHHVCNWLVTNGPAEAFCRACRLNDTIPDLRIESNFGRWCKLEIAKRRCVYTYLRLGLPLEVGPQESCAPLRFKFLADKPGEPVLTGHENGLITINISEADGDERERRRLSLHEPYRTLVGHFRHETGHYYWDRLVANTNYLTGFRNLFGDERLDYGAAMKQYYQAGPAPGWQQRTITPYASWHPWEDWAETWAHYLHMADTMETAASFGLSSTGIAGETPSHVSPLPAGNRDFDKLLDAWQPLAVALNSVNRSMGLSDLYPFVIPELAVKKLRFIHDLIMAQSQVTRSPAPAVISGSPEVLSGLAQTV